MEESLTNYIIISSIIFTIMLLLGIFVIPNIFGNYYKDVSPEELRINSLNNPIEKALPRLLLNNIIVSMMLVSFGLLGNKLLPSIFLGYNALMIGENINMLSRPETFPVLYSILPHGIIEIPAIILCTAFSYKFAYSISNLTGNRGFVHLITSKESINNVVYKNAIIPYFKYIFPLIVISVVIECTISIYILRAIFNGV